MKRFLLFQLLICSSTIFAQDQTMKNLQSVDTIKKNPNDTISKTWKTGGVLSLNLSQASLSNWAAGGDDYSLSINAFINAYAYYKKGKNSWDNNLNTNYGLVNTTSLGTRKNNDLFDFTSKYGYELSPKLNLAFLFDFRTQFSKGYAYTNPNTKILTSDFMAPGYLLISLGLDYHPVQNFSIFISPITSRWTFVNNDLLSSQGAYGVTPGNKTLNEIGAFASLKYATNLTKIISYQGRLDLFSNYKHEPQNVDLYMTNLFAVKLSKVLSATWNFNMIYDNDVKIFGPNHNSPRLQTMSLIGVGLLVKFGN